MNGENLSSILNRPLTLVVLGLICTFGGATINDRVSASAHGGEVTVRLNTLERQINAIEADRKGYISREEFQQFSNAIKGSIDAMRQDLGEIKTDLRRR
jgi:predicted transcriptional regulator